MMFLNMLCIISTSTAQLPSPKKILQKKVLDKAGEIINKKTNNANETSDTIPQKSETEENETSEANSKSKTEQPNFQTFSKFDFVPGEKVVFFEDFAQDNIGEFPLGWNTNGMGEVVQNNIYNGKWFKFTGSDTYVWNEGILDLPENFTLEFDVIPIAGENDGMEGYKFKLYQTTEPDQNGVGSTLGRTGIELICEYFGRISYYAYENEKASGNLSGYKDADMLFQKLNKKYHISISIQKSRVRIYQDENKFFDLPKALLLADTKLNKIGFSSGAALVTNIRIAGGLPDLRSKLITEGKLVSYGIYFDVNKDQVKPESYATLKTISDILKENPGIKISIIGHTDADGNDQANLELSKRRAASVKDELIKNFGIDGSRIATDGKGESQPIGPNDTASNKAKNRRVEFIKL